MTDELSKRLEDLVQVWERDTLHESSTSRLVSHPAFEAIVAMGTPAVPLIVERLRLAPTWLVLALPRITGENPVSEGDAGRLARMVAAWAEWFDRHGVSVAPETQVIAR